MAVNEASLVTKIVPFCSSLTGAHWFQSSLNQNIPVGIILKLNGSRFSLWKQENVSDSGNQCSSKIYSCQCISSSFCCRQCIISKTHNSSLSEEKFVRFFRFSWYWIKNCFLWRMHNILPLLFTTWSLILLSQTSNKLTLSKITMLYIFQKGLVSTTWQNVQHVMFTSF